MAYMTKKRIKEREALEPRSLMEVVPRPAPPDELSEEEASVWRSIVNSMPAEHFMAANYHLLEKLCRHIVTGRKLDARVDDELRKRRVDERNLEYLTKMRSRETLAIVTLSRTMRITQQSVYLPHTVARRIKG